MSDAPFISEEIRASISVQEVMLRESVSVIEQIASLISTRLKAGNKLLLFGNGGSAADAQHIAAELVGRYQAERRGLPAIALTVNSSTVTAVGNDYSFQEIFARQIEALGEPGDVAVGISTSGNSPNVLRGLEAAAQKDLFTVGLSGRGGGKMKALAGICLCVPSEVTPRIQEAHILVGHILSGIVEKAFLPESEVTQGEVLSTMQKQ